MIYFLFLAFGLILGLSIKSRLLNWYKSIIPIFNRKTFVVKFHVYFIIHQSGARINQQIKTNTVQVTLSAKNEDEAIEFLNDLINNEARIEIESIEYAND
jgi:hypothetical protein